MIPEFPNFKILELSDKIEVEKFTNMFPTHSDFNFISMWVWNIHNKTEISQLNGNLVVHFCDYLSNDDFLSFMGDKKILETTKELINHSKRTLGKNFLKLIPEEILLQYKDSIFHTKADPGSYDYIYLTETLIDIHTWTQNSCSRKIRKFLNRNPNYRVETTTLNNITKSEYLELFKNWAENKKLNITQNLNEFKAFDRLLETDTEDLTFISIYLEDKMIGFSVYEILPDDYAIAHFSKGNIKICPEIYDVLNWEESKVLFSKGVKYLNWEQDLNLPGLRFSKQKYKPYFLRRKFIVGEKKKNVIINTMSSGTLFITTTIIFLIVSMAITFHNTIIKKEFEGYNIESISTNE